MSVIHEWKYKGVLPVRGEDGRWNVDAGQLCEIKRELKKRAARAGVFEGIPIITIHYIMPTMTVDRATLYTSDELLMDAMVDAGVLTRSQVPARPDHKLRYGPRNPRVKVVLEELDDWEGGVY